MDAEGTGFMSEVPSCPSVIYEAIAIQSNQLAGKDMMVATKDELRHIYKVHREIGHISS